MFPPPLVNPELSLFFKGKSTFFYRIYQILGCLPAKVLIKDVFTGKQFIYADCKGLAEQVFSYPGLGSTLIPYPAADHGGIPSAVSPRDHSQGIYHLYRLWAVRTDTVHRLDSVGGCGPYLCWGLVAGGVSGRSPY